MRSTFLIAVIVVISFLGRNSLNAQEIQSPKEIIIINKSTDIKINGNKKEVKFGVRGASKNELMAKAEKVRKFNHVYDLKIEEEPNLDGIYWGSIVYDTALKNHVLYRYLMNLGVEILNVEGHRKPLNELMEKGTPLEKIKE